MLRKAFLEEIKRRRSSQTAGLDKGRMQNTNIKSCGYNMIFIDRDCAVDKRWMASGWERLREVFASISLYFEMMLIKVPQPFHVW